MLEVEGIEVWYGDLRALQEVTLEVRAGEVVTLVGANGAGKTTTMRAVSGILRPRRGAIRFEGDRIDRLTPDAIVARGIVQVPEGRRIFPSLTVEENLELGAFTARAKPRRRESMDRVYALFPVLRGRRRQRAGTLSGGEQQMLAIGRGLMALPRLLMLDEPSLGLAPLMVAEVFRVMDEIHRGGATILLVEQNVRQALAASQRGYVLENGRVALSGPAADLLRDAHTQRAYLGR
jgi:branched-chain amino acid transport system ATP-binding protein